MANLPTENFFHFEKKTFVSLFASTKAIGWIKSTVPIYLFVLDVPQDRIRQVKVFTKRISPKRVRSCRALLPSLFICNFS